MAKVIIIVKNGCVQEVQTDNPALDIFVVDYDIREENPNTEIIDGYSADVWPAIPTPITLDL